jgi:hypothetical protein
MPAPHVIKLPDRQTSGAILSLNKTVTMASLMAVRWFTKSAAVLMLALWVPVTMHCALETVPGFGFLQWCCGGDETSQQDHDCSSDSCSVLESGFYRIEDNPAVAPSLAVVLALAASDWVAELRAEPVLHFVPVSSAPPELPRFWQFSYRAALPPRAPSPLA